MFEFEFLRYAIAGSVLAGILLSLAGVLLLLLDMPFLGICMSHAAFLGAIVAVLVGVHPLAGALTAAELVWLAGTALVVTLLVLAFHRWIAAVLYDRDVARSRAGCRYARCCSVCCSPPEPRSASAPILSADF